MASVRNRVGMYLGAVALAALAVGCGQGALKPAKPAAQPDIETRAVPLKQPRELPRLLAPPPAYGNKIVMARGADVTALEW